MEGLGFQVQQSSQQHSILRVDGDDAAIALFLQPNENPDGWFVDWYTYENLIPLQGKEITQNIHPLACGLGDLVHESKGCYIGQEILARMRSRGRQGKQLMRISNPVIDATTIGKTHSLAIRRSK